MPLYIFCRISSLRFPVYNTSTVDRTHRMQPFPAPRFSTRCTEQKLCTAFTRAWYRLIAAFLIAARLNRRKNAVYAALMEQLTDYGVRLVDFDKLSGQEGRELEAYFDREIAPLLSPLLVGRRQPFPFLQDKEIYAVGVLAGKNGHEKLCLVTRREKGRTEYYTQIGTGNYNEKTSRLYTDLSLMTANTAIGLEAAAVFQALSKGETVDAAQQLLVAPKCLQNRILDYIGQEMEFARRGEAAYIGAKINSLTDKAIIDKLIPGVMILQYLTSRFKVDEITASHYGVREGYLQQKIQPSLSDAL